MKKTQNKVTLIGYIGKEPRLFTFPNGSTKTCLKVATAVFIPKKNGENQKITTWHDVVTSGKTAEIAFNDFSTGSHILVEGSINYRTYPDKSGHLRYVTEIQAHSLMNLDR